MNAHVNGKTFLYINIHVSCIFVKIDLMMMNIAVIWHHLYQDAWKDYHYAMINYVSQGRSSR